MKRHLFLSALAALFFFSAVQSQFLKVSDNHRFLVTENGEPFFWLGDTGWEMLHRLDRGEMEHYLRNRAGKGFTVIQTVILTVASIAIAAVAYFNVTPTMLADVLPADWTSLVPKWKLDDAASLPEAYAGYELFGALVIVWV